MEIKFKRHVSFNSRRNFGVEFEFIHPNNSVLNNIIENDSMEPSICVGWQHDCNNHDWICKTDASCGYEIASRVLCGVKGIYTVGNIVEILKNNNVKYNESCGLHIHVEICDFSKIQFDIMCAWWVKAEQCFLSMQPNYRRNNPYCACINNNEYVSSLNENGDYSLSELVASINDRRFTINTNLFRENCSHGSRIEFRLSEMSLNKEYVKNCIRLFILFVETCKNLPAPSNLKWFTPKQLIRFMGFMDDNNLVKKTFSSTIISMKNQLINSIRRWNEINLYRTNMEVEEIIRKNI